METRQKRYPSYRIPLQSIAEITLSLLSGQPRDIREISKKILYGIDPAPTYFGKENIPDSGHFLLTLNHYARVGFSIVWAAAALSAVMPMRPTWVMTSAWTKRSGFFDQVQTRATQILFSRFATTYGAITMPPMPPHPKEIADRAVSIRKIIRCLRNEPRTILCLAPEGEDLLTGGLGQPHPGTGKLISMISMHLETILPVGVFEQKGNLIINFGLPYQLKHKKDDQSIMDEVMSHIAGLLERDMVNSNGSEKE